MRALLPSALASAVESRLDTWTSGGHVARLWQRDPSLWTASGEEQWLGWLDLPISQRERLSELEALSREVRAAGFSHVLLLGMGGSSLCPEVLTRTFGTRDGYPSLHVLDSTDPAQVRAAEHRVDLAKTLVVVASKSGSTLEPAILMAHFLARMAEVVGAAAVGRHFVAITDPGSQLEREATERGFRRVVHGIASVGGRFSALSVFGLVPAALIGIDLEVYLSRAAAMADACADGAAPANPGVRLGVVLGEAALAGRDKMTIVTSPALRELGAWLEQLVAESTGKRGKAIIPVDREPLVAAERYGHDRIFVAVRLADDTLHDAHALRLAGLARLGHPVIEIELGDRLDLGAELFRWEVATAVAGAILGVNPFDQPDVEASKIETKALTAAFERDGALPVEEPFFRDGSIELFADPENAAALHAATSGEASLGALLAAHFDRLSPVAPGGDYAAILAYLEMNNEVRAPLEELRQLLVERDGHAVCLGFGPRFLHSTGQAYKGGPNTGVFLQLTAEDALDLPVPGRAPLTFGTVKAAQARGDLAVLAARGRRHLRVHLGANLSDDLARLLAVARNVLR